MAGASTPRGWYAAEGDPAGTQRWWDGAQWVGEPQPIPAQPATPDPSSGTPDLPLLSDTVSGADIPEVPDAIAAAGSSMPEMPGFSTPDVSSMPDVATPDMPDVVTPDLPTMADLSSPDAGMPAIPGSALPPQDGTGPLPGPGSFPGAPMPAPAGSTGFFAEPSQATLALVLSIVGFFCGITAPFGLWFGWKEREGIDAGRRDPANRGQAVAAIVIGAITTVLFVLGIAFFVLLFVGVAAFGA